ncbi:MAG: mechanosensitive ion channel [Spirochaetia bacterium]
MDLRHLQNTLDPTLFALLAILLVGLFGLAVSVLLRHLLLRTARRGQHRLLVRLIERFGAPSRLLFPLIGIAVLLPFLDLPAEIRPGIGSTLRILFVLDITWFLLRLFSTTERFLLQRYDISVSDNLRARRMHTQVRVIRRILTALVILIAAASALTTFETVRQLGTTILASAGILGIILGFAAQKSLGLILAGLQVAIAQPIRIDDVVIVEGEWGRIEEITLTFVVVAIWDRRRMVLPVSYFIEKPFENWTRASAQILGSVYLFVDYAFPVDDLRNKLYEFLQESRLWDGEAWVLQVTDATEKTIELRALMTAKDSPTSWDLRCEIREKMIAYIRDEHPGHLPHLRASLDGDASETPPRDATEREMRGPEES